MTTPYDAFHQVDLRVGRVIRCEPHSAARKPAYKLWIDFGPVGILTSSAQLTALYQPPELEGRLVVAAVNLGSRSIAGFTSDALVLGADDESGRVVLLSTDRDVPLGQRVY
jgi:tRNA-binding protein